MNRRELVALPFQIGSVEQRAIEQAVDGLVRIERLASSCDEGKDLEVLDVIVESISPEGHRKAGTDDERA